MHLPQTQHLEDPQSQQDDRVRYPLQMALRNSAVALLGIALTGGAYWLKLHSHGDTRVTGDLATYWWIWTALTVFVIAICFAHAYLGARLGAKKSATFLKVIVALALAAMLAGLWWYLQPRNGGV
jgi:hypothetical protein